MSKQLKASGHGGARKGAGRPAAEDPKVKIWFSVKQSRAEEAKARIARIIAKINE